MAVSEPTPPRGAEYLWNAFLALSEARRYDQGDPQPLSLLEIKAWTELYARPLSPREIEIIQIMDGVFRNTFARVMRTNEKRREYLQGK
ncbi:hypothetical protein FF098_014840 [Parvularcula flava]|nr:hypothetical protein [Aquisalinus luteolus]NHK29195.1 hypothetical protein [Aquisalinus luteolus]